MTELQIKIIKCYARNDMKLQPTAEEMHYHRNSILYHMRKIEEDTGLNPQKFYDLCVLLFSYIGGLLKLPTIDSQKTSGGDEQSG